MENKIIVDAEKLYRKAARKILRIIEDDFKAEVKEAALKGICGKAKYKRW